MINDCRIYIHCPYGWASLAMTIQWLVAHGHSWSCWAVTCDNQWGNVHIGRKSHLWMLWQNVSRHDPVGLRMQGGYTCVWYVGMPARNQSNSLSLLHFDCFYWSNHYTFWQFLFLRGSVYYVISSGYQLRKVLPVLIDCNSRSRVISTN